jgi:hypothetical protein
MRVGHSIHALTFVPPIDASTYGALSAISPGSRGIKREGGKSKGTSSDAFPGAQMSHPLSLPSMLRASLLAATLAAPLLACTQADTSMSGSSTPPAPKASSTSDDVVGGGGPLDQIYREIYTPGDPRWSNEY